MGIRRKMASGAFWGFIEKGGEQISSLVVFAIIARLIGPEEYGLVSLCFIFLALTYSLFTGLVDPIISLQIKDDERRSTIFWSVMVLGILLGGLIFSFSGAIAGIFGDLRLKPLLRVFSSLPILLALYSVPFAIVTSTLNFRIFAIRTFTGTIIGGCVGIYMAFHDYGAYSLAGQQIAAYLVTNVAVWLGSGWRPHWMFSNNDFISITKLGFGRSGSAFLTFLESEVPKALLGLFSSPLYVGQLAFVMRLRYSLRNLLLQPINAVIYPAFSIIQQDSKEQQDLLNNIVIIFGFLVFPVIILASFLSNEYIPLLFGDKWSETIPLVEFYFISTAPVSFNIVICDILRANKKINDFLRYQFVVTSLWILCIFFLVRISLTVLLIGEVIMHVLALMIYTRLLVRKTDISITEGFKQLVPSIISSVALAGFLFPCKYKYLIASSRSLDLGLKIFIALMIYLSLFSLLERKRLKQTITYFLNKKRSRN